MSETDESVAEKNIKLVRVSQLPIYSYQERVYEYEPPNHPSAVTSFRKFLFGVADSAKRGFDTVSFVYETGVAHTNVALNYVQSEPAGLQRAGVISLAALTGVVASFRKRPVTRLMYGGLLGGAAASLCYPKETVSMVNASYGVVKERATTYWEQYRPGSPYTPQTTALKPAPEYYETSEAGKEPEEPSTSEQPVTPSPSKPEEDKGMGKDEEAFMYTTRK